MAARRIMIELPDEMAQALERIAKALGISSQEEAAIIALADWISRRTAEIDDRDPDRRYFVNEALDELIHKKDR